MIQVFLIDKNINRHGKKHETVSPEDIKGNKVLVQPVNDIAWLILATTSFSSSHRQLVNIRCPSNISFKKYTISTSNMLFQDTLKALAHDGNDATRKGGSNVNTTYHNSVILSLLKSNNAFVRKGRGVKVVKR